MSNRKATSIKDDWLQKFDWLEKKTEFSARCRLCDCEINVSMSGLTALTKHAQSVKHKRTIQDRRLQQTLTPFIKLPSGTGTCQNEKESVTQSEMRWVTFLVEHNVALLASDHVSVVKQICPDSDLAKKMSCGRTKATYLLRHGICEELFDRLLQRLRRNESNDTFFSLMLDESNEAGARKFLIILIRYFDEDTNKVKTDIYRLPQIDDGKAATLESVVWNALLADQLPTENLLTIMTDSPAVMTGSSSGFLKRMQDRCPQLVDLGRCSLHHVSNAVNYAVEQLGGQAEILIDSLHHYFLFTSRWTSYMHVSFCTITSYFG